MSRMADNMPYLPRHMASTHNELTCLLRRRGKEGGECIHCNVCHVWLVAASEGLVANTLRPLAATFIQ